MYIYIYTYISISSPIKGAERVSASWLVIGLSQQRAYQLPRDHV